MVRSRPWSTTVAVTESIRPRPVALSTSTSRSGSAGSTYSAWKIVHRVAADTSPPPASVWACTARENSICSRRGRSRLCSAFMM